MCAFCALGIHYSSVVFREQPPRMIHDRIRLDKVDRSKEAGVSSGTTPSRQPQRDVFSDSSQTVDGLQFENKRDEIGSSTQTERGYFGERPPRRGGRYRGRRMSRGGFWGHSDRSRFDDEGRVNRNGFSSPGMANEHSDVSDRFDRNGPPRAPQDQRGRRGWRGRGGYRRPFPREYPPG